MAKHNDFGKWGEKLAAEFLVAKGYEMVHRNWRCGHWEIDIIAESAERLAFVEVKTRRSEYMQRACQAINSQKQQHLLSAAHAFIQAENREKSTYIDVITVVGSPKSYTIEHYENAIKPTLTCF